MLSLNILLLIFGLFLLLKGGDFLIIGSERISRNHGVKPIIIGMTVVAFGTSLPEFFVSFMANIKGSQAIGLGNIIGSNIANIALILGIAALFQSLKIDRDTLKKDFPIVFGVSLIAFLMMLDGVISRLDGTILTAGFIAYLMYVYFKAKSGKEDLLEEEIGHSKKHWHNYALVIVGIIGLYFGADLTIANGTIIAKIFGVSDLVIGLTIVAVGTSLPELAATIAAIKNNNHEIGVGNIVGSNIFNILFVLGINSIVKEFAVDSTNIYIWGPLMLVITLLLFPLFGKKLELNRKGGIILLAIYAAYTTMTFLIK